MNSATLDWPFFDAQHRDLARKLDKWARREITEGVAGQPDEVDTDEACRSLIRKLGEGGWLRYTVPAPYGGLLGNLDVRSLCVIRETLSRISGLADISFAMQGLGAGPISLFGSAALKKKYLRSVAAGKSIAAFAISEKNAGSDISSMETTARRVGKDYVIDGEKTWISNGGIADFYVVFCREESSEAKPRFTALVVEPDDKGFSVPERIRTIAPHPLGRLTFDSCRVPATRLVGDAGKGLRIALGTLDVFRSTVGAAALGFARRALDEALAYATERKMFGQHLKDFQLTQARLAQMATEIDASALLVYRAAWTRDNGAERVTREAAMAKMYATEAAQRVIDSALQLLGGRGVAAGNAVEQLYREIRSLRIYEGTTEVQQLVIAGQVLAAYQKADGQNA
ncbi:MAG TPA: acyl-CoA dehydrogenase family protein [Gemmatimonadaceae bacterium]|nr:acyl-CoA dehydrogenase family protein [Gemmatimonadaceae bacterium]